MSNQLWPSQKTSTGKSSKSTYQGWRVETNWAAGFLTTLVIVVLAGAAVGALYHFVLADLFTQLQTVSNHLPGAGLNK